MNRFDSVTKPGIWFMVLASILTACGEGSPILGGGGAPVPATLADFIRPRVTVTVPVNLSTTHPDNAAITAVFTEAMDPATITATSFTLATDTVPAVPVTGTVTYIATSKTARFSPSAVLTPGASYTATISTVATDLAGNELAGNQAALPAASDYVWSFTVAAGDIISPSITLTAPADTDIDVALNASVNATFDEPMDPATIDTTTFTLETSAAPAVPVTGVVTYDLVNNVATFTPSSNLSPSTSYTATVTTGATDLAANALVAGIVSNPWSFTTGTGLAPGAIALGSASTFGLMATAAVTAASDSIINGDVSLEPGTSMTGFPPAIVNGSIHINDTVSALARTDLLKAYNEAKALPCATDVGTVDLGGLYVFPTGIPPGVYCSGSSMLVGAQIVLDGGGDTNSVWVFQIGSSLTTTADITLTGGAQAKNVFWVPTQDVSIGTGTTFSGTIVAGRDATSAGSATINGRILAGAITAGTIALNGPSSTVNVPLP